MYLYNYASEVLHKWPLRPPDYYLTSKGVLINNTIDSRSSSLLTSRQVTSLLHWDVCLCLPTSNYLTAPQSLVAVPSQP